MNRSNRPSLFPYSSRVGAAVPGTNPGFYPAQIGQGMTPLQMQPPPMQPRAIPFAQAARPLIVPRAPTLDDALAQQIVNVWKQAFSDAALLPVIGFPSNNHGVATFTHTMGPNMPPLTINGLPSRSPLSNNALGSAEVSNGRWLNLYEIMLPDVPGSNGDPSSAQRYANALMRTGIDVHGNHYHWSGARAMGQFPLAIHSVAVGMDPVEFAQKQLAAMKFALTGR